MWSLNILVRRSYSNFMYKLIYLMFDYKRYQTMYHHVRGLLTNKSIGIVTILTKLSLCFIFFTTEVPVTVKPGLHGQFLCDKYV